MTKEEKQKLQEEIKFGDREEEIIEGPDGREVPVQREEFEDAILTLFFSLDSLCYLVDEMNGGNHDEYEQAIVNLLGATIEQTKRRADTIVKAITRGLGKIDLIHPKHGYGEDFQWFTAQIKEA